MTTQLKVTTSTLVVRLNGEIDIYALAKWLPISRVDGLQMIGKNKAKVTPDGIHENIPIFIKSPQFRRGTILNKTRAFKHSVSLWILLKESFPCLKVSGDTIHLTGIKNRQSAINAINYIIGKMNTLKTLRSLLQNDTPVDFLDENTDVKVCLDTYKKEESQYVEMLDDLKKYNGLIIREDTTIKTILNSMINYNYKVGFELNLTNVYEVFGQIPGFISFYPITAYAVKIFLPYTQPTDQVIAKKKRPTHTFIVYQNGSITQSGPGDELSDIARNIFINALLDNYKNVCA